MPLAVHCVFRGAWYARCGTSGPIFRDGCWEFVAPCPRFSTGICCVRGRHTSLRALPAPGVHTAEVRESHGDSSLASAVKTHCDNDIVAFSMWLESFTLVRLQRVKLCAGGWSNASLHVC